MRISQLWTFPETDISPSPWKVQACANAALVAGKIFTTIGNNTKKPLYLLGLAAVLSGHIANAINLIPRNAPNLQNSDKLMSTIMIADIACEIIFALQGAKSYVVAERAIEALLLTGTVGALAYYSNGDQPQIPFYPLSQWG